MPFSDIQQKNVFFNSSYKELSPTVHQSNRHLLAEKFDSDKKENTHGAKAPQVKSVNSSNQLFVDSNNNA